MKGKTMGRGVKALAVSLAIGLGMTACSRDYVLGYLYVPNAQNPATITAYAIDYQSGALTQLSDSPITLNGADASTLVVSPDNEHLYVALRGTNSSSIAVLDIGTDGKLYAAQYQPVVTGGGLTGSIPTALAIDPAGNFLYVTFLYQNGFGPLNPGPGGIAIFPIVHSSTPTTNGQLGAPLMNTTIGTTAATPLPYVPVGDNPVGITIPATGGYVYVVDQEQPLTPSAHGVLLAFTENTSTGVLSVAGSYPGGVKAGTTPSAIAEDPTGHFIYVTDEATNQMYGYLATTGGVPQAMLNSPFNTSLYPVAITIDPRGTFIYVANYASSTVSTYVINSATGAVSGGTGITVATGPTCVTVDPALGLYLYTSNYTDNSVSASQLNPHTGALTQVQGTQFSSQPLPTCAVAVANGAHATQIVE